MTGADPRIQSSRRLPESSNAEDAPGCRLGFDDAVALVPQLSGLNASPALKERPPVIANLHERCVLEPVRRIPLVRLSGAGSRSDYQRAPKARTRRMPPVDFGIATPRSSSARSPLSIRSQRRFTYRLWFRTFTSAARLNQYRWEYTSTGRAARCCALRRSVHDLNSWSSA